MSKPIIMARSPFLVEVDEATSKGSELHIYIKNGNGSWSVDPSYKLTKKTTTPTETRTQYDVSAYIREYLKDNNKQTFPVEYNIPISDYPINLWCNVKIERYNVTNAGTDYLDYQEYYAFDGYLNSRDDFKFNIFQGSPATIMQSNCGNIYVPELIYNQLGVSFVTLWAGFFVIVNGDGYYTQVQGTEIINSIDSDDPQYLVINAVDNLETYVYNSEDELVYTFTPERKCLPKYRPIRLDFVNRFGVWQQCWFFGADYETVNSKSDEYQLMQDVQSYPNVNTEYGSGLNGYNYKQRQTLNKNGVKTFKVNTDWVQEQWNVCLEEIMMSENLILSFYETTPEISFSDTNANKISYPVKLNTNTIQLNRHINEKLINYTLEFEYLSPIVNTII